MSRKYSDNKNRNKFNEENTEKKGKAENAENKENSMKKTMEEELKEKIKEAAVKNSNVFSKSNEHANKASSRRTEKKPESKNDLNALKNRIKELEEESSDLKDQLLRKQADFENFRKRMFREKEDAIRYANSRLLLDLTNVIDDFERAINSAEKSRDFDSFLEGISLIEKQMTTMLENRWGLKRFSSQGEKFDPDKHEAIASEESEEIDDTVVLEDYQKGYYLNDRLLRPARVKVAKPVAVLDKKEDENHLQAENKDKENIT